MRERCRSCNPAVSEWVSEKTWITIKMILTSSTRWTGHPLLTLLGAASLPIHLCASTSTSERCVWRRWLSEGVYKLLASAAGIAWSSLWMFCPSLFTQTFPPTSRRQLFSQEEWNSSLSAHADLNFWCSWIVIHLIAVWHGGISRTDTEWSVCSHLEDFLLHTTISTETESSCLEVGS
jgi:hypothetical protein